MAASRSESGDTNSRNSPTVPLFLDKSKKKKKNNNMKAKQCVESLEMWANSPLPKNELNNSYVAAHIEGIKMARREVLALIQQYHLNMED